MSVDLQGPANAPNFTTSRPGDTRVFGGVDTWFKDCTSSVANDGTKLQAGWTNGVLAQLRNLIRGNGLNIGASAPIVTEDNADDGMALKAVQYLIQRGQQIYALDSSGSIGTVTVSLSPPLIEYKTGMSVIVKMANDCVGATVININALGNKNVVKAPGAQALVGGEWKAGDLVALRYDGAAFQGNGLGQRAPLTANVNIYVNPSTGSDTALDGSSATVSGTHGPFATVTKALAVVAQFAPGTFGATINLSASTHDAGTGFFSSANWAHCNVTITGAGIGSTLITGHASTSQVLVTTGPNNYTLQNFAISYTGSGAQSATLNVSNAAHATINNVQFNGALGGTGAFIRCSSATVAIGTITLNAGCGGALFACDASGTIGFSGATVNCASVNVGTFVAASFLGLITTAPTPPTFPSGGLIVGQRFTADSNAVVSSGGGGATFWPGNAAGTTSTGGQYV